MLKFVFSPTWFFGIDAAFEAVTMIIALLIAARSMSIYYYVKESRYFWFGTAFLMLATAFAGKILTNLVLYYNVIETYSFGLAEITHEAVRTSANFHTISFLMYRFLTLMAFLGIYLVYTSKVKTARSAIFFFSYFVLITVLFSSNISMIFHLTAFLLLAMISLLSLKNWYKTRSRAAKYVTASFAIIMISQLTFMPALYNNIAYVAAEVIQLIGYSSMLLAYVLTGKNAKN
tara:strand:+ start:462 stop:1157 length:696 start_codon:yes stop_codon:yes gene_type:complete